MKRGEKIFLICVLSLFTGMIGYSVWKRNRIDSNPAYVLARAYSVHDTENGSIYSFKYVYDSVEYEGGIKGFIRMKDTLIVLKILKDNPKLWEHVERMP